MSYTYTNHRGPDGISTFSTNTRIWYMDSMAVEEIRQPRFFSDSNGTVRGEDSIGYLFIDFRKKMFYSYSNFSDTSRPVQAFHQADSIVIINGSMFYYNKRLELQNYQVLPDTTIDAINYKRVKFKPLWDYSVFYGIGYLRCDMYDSMFSLEKFYSDSMGCTMTKVEIITTANDKKINSEEISTLRHYLTKSEKKIFNTWKKYAQNNAALRAL